MSPAPKPGPTNNRRSLAIMVVAGVVVLAAIVALAISLSTSSSSPPPPSNNTQAKIQVGSTWNATQVLHQNFDTAYAKCSTATCVNNAALTAFNSQANVAGQLNTGLYPPSSTVQLQEYAASLEYLQRVYLQLSENPSIISIRQVEPSLKGLMVATGLSVNALLHALG